MQTCSVYFTKFVKNLLNIIQVEWTILRVPSNQKLNKPNADLPARVIAVSDAQGRKIKTGGTDTRTESKPTKQNTIGETPGIRKQKRPCDHS